MLNFKFRNLAANLHEQGKFYRGVIFGLILLCFYLAHGWQDAKKGMPIYIPPDLRSGAVVKLNDPKPYDVYSFALMITQLLNHWPKDGAKDYGENIFKLAAYLTPKCAGELEADLKQRSRAAVDGIGTPVNELSGRVRTAQPYGGQAYTETAVTVLGKGVWVADLDLHIDESVKGMNVKSINIHYPVRVIAYDVDPSLNPYGIAVDCYAAPGPTRTDGNLKAAQVEGTGHAPARP